MQSCVDGRGRGKAVQGDRDRQAGEARETPPATTRLATPALPRSRRWLVSCRSSSSSGSSNQIGDAGVAALRGGGGQAAELTCLDLCRNHNISQQAKDAQGRPAQL